MQYLLRSAVPIVGAPSLEETQVLIDGQTTDDHEVKLDPVVLNVADHFRQIVYLAPGNIARLPIAVARWSGSKASASNAESPSSWISPGRCLRMAFKI